tara:strand:+ start:642 stop:905 length:264 start_codon:yes stop_codon:yes gene_type:complete
MKVNKKFLINLIKEEMSSLYDGEEETVFKEREMSHEISKTLSEISRYIMKATDDVEYPTDMDTIEIQVKQLKNWEDVLTKFLMAIGG